MNRRVRAYAELLRPANVTTAAADVLAGYGVAGAGNHRAAAWLVCAGACLYAGGIVLNDYYDRALDATERPERPIPSGRVSAGTAATLGYVLLAAGVAAAWQTTTEALTLAVSIALLVVLYDAWSKHSPVLGPLNMGLCRALNLLMGVAVAPLLLREHWPLGFIPLVYIVAITALSRGEVIGGIRGVALFSLVSIGVVVVALVGMSWSAWSAAAGAFVCLFGWRILPAFWRAWQAPEPGIIRVAVKTGVLSLVLLDASIAAAYAGFWHGTLVVTMAILAASLARLFAVT